ncbi:hypothetical protein HU200_052847 [Digitaria exilis]|uniref:Uncharacterized protein n=1 Tax=Digitaria exilis TaxID=1010633 RepID=A0A835E401_9POAL|nr:hypothetical protein HU200_052847 [Digitaria exilis]
MSWAFRAFYRISLLIMQVVIWILYLPVISILFGPPILCFMLSAYRLDKDNDFKDDGDASKANLKPALNIFYSLAVAQSILHIVWINIVEGIKGSLTLYVCNKYGYERRAMDDYITETKRKCIHDMALADDWNLITYALSLLDSESIDSDEYCSGLRILDTLIEEKVPVNRLMVQSLRQRIQKLIRTLGWRRPTDRETRELAARILAHLASDLSLADFPGALESISSLLETQCYKKDQEYLHFPLSKNRSRRSRKKSVLEDMIDKQGPANQQNYYMLLGNEQSIKIGKGKREELILQGLRIIENLAHNEHNCTEIYENKDLISKIIAPVKSDKFIEEVVTNGDCSVRALDGSLKVVSRLIGAHGDMGKNLRQDIAGNINVGRKDPSPSKENMTTAVSNLFAVLGMKRNSNILGLQTRAIEIVSQLFLDESTNLDRAEREKFIQSLLQFFLSEEWMSEYFQEKHTEAIREAATIKVDNNIILLSSPLLNWLMKEHEKKKMGEAKKIASHLKAKAGEALALLSMGSQSNSKFLMNSTRCGDVNHCLTKMLDSKITTIKCPMTGNEVLDMPIKIGCRISAAEILKHLCVDSAGDRSFCKMVLRKPRHTACVSMLKIICKMVILLVQHGHYVQDFKDKKIMDALSEASKTMASLEGCMLFSGMDVDSYGVPLKPVSSVLVEEARQFLDGQTTGAGLVVNDTIPLLEHNNDCIWF